MCHWFSIPYGGVRATKTDNIITRDDTPEDFVYIDPPFNVELGLTRLRELILVLPNRALEAVDLPVKYRLLHYAIHRNLSPTKGSNNYISGQDVEIIWHLEEGKNH